MKECLPSTRQGIGTEPDIKNYKEMGGKNVRRGIRVQLKKAKKKVVDDSCIKGPKGKKQRASTSPPTKWSFPLKRPNARRRIVVCQFTQSNGTHDGAGAAVSSRRRTAIPGRHKRTAQQDLQPLGHVSRN